VGQVITYRMVYLMLDSNHVPIQCDKQIYPLPPIVSSMV
jgi:hypothetical protein